MKRIHLLFLLFAIFMAGCTSERPKPLSNGAMGFNFYSDYDGSRWNDDYDVFAKIETPTWEYTLRIGDSGEKAVADGGGSFVCSRQDDEWRNRPWWLELTLYTEGDERVMVDHQRVEDADCFQYSVEIAPDGSMKIYEGYPPWHPEYPRSIPWTAITLGALGLAIAATALIVWLKRK